MHIQKRTYSIDEGVLQAFESAVASGSRSIVINNLIRKYLAERERGSIREALIKGAKQMNAIYLEESESWYPLEEEIANASSAGQTKSRRRRSS